MNDESNQIKPRGGKANAKKPRTKAQKEASRKNGAKSKGPVSEDGKRTSRQNALRHGLTAKFLTPPKDPRNQHQLYEQIHTELYNEYEPKGFTAKSIVSNLANDYIQMIRCRQMMEALQKPQSLSRNEQEVWEEEQLKREDLQSIEDAIGCLVAKEDLNFHQHVARALAEKISLLVTSLRKDINEINSYDEEKPEFFENFVSFEDDEIKEKRELWETIKSLRKRLTEVDHLTRIFSGNAVPSPMESKRLIAVLKVLKTNTTLSMDSRPEVEAKIDNLNHQVLMNLACDPERIMLLERYLRDIERSIDRKFKQLRDIEALGSFRENDA